MSPCDLLEPSKKAWLVAACSHCSSTLRNSQVSIQQTIIELRSAAVLCSPAYTPQYSCAAHHTNLRGVICRVHPLGEGTHRGVQRPAHALGSDAVLLQPRQELAAL